MSVGCKATLGLGAGRCAGQWRVPRLDASWGDTTGGVKRKRSNRGDSKGEIEIGVRFVCSCAKSVTWTAARPILQGHLGMAGSLARSSSGGLANGLRLMADLQLSKLAGFTSRETLSSLDSLSGKTKSICCNLKRIPQPLKSHAELTGEHLYMYCTVNVTKYFL